MNQLSKTLVHSCLQLRQLWFCLALMLAGAGMAMAQTPQAIWTAGDGTLTFVNSTTTYAKGDTFNKQTVTAVWSGRAVTESASTPAWNKTVKTTLKNVVFAGSFESVRPASLSEWFSGCSKLTAIEGISNLNTSKVTNMSCMFYDCSSLTSLDVSKFDTRNVTGMGSMFYNCSNLTSLDVSKFDTSKVTVIGSMFKGCSNLTSLDVSKFDTSKVTDLFGMFNGCSNLTSLDVSKFNTSKVKNMSYMFNNCSNLTTIFCNDTWKATTSSTNMFGGCTKLVGEYGTSYPSSATDASKANPGEEGYFTLSKEVLKAHDGGDGWWYTTYYNFEHSRYVDVNTEVYVAWPDWDENKVYLEENDDYVDKRLLKGNAFILRSKQPTITLSLCSKDGLPIGGGALSSNQLEGSAKTTNVPSGQSGHIITAIFYTLGKVNGVLGFYEYTGDKLNARKAFLLRDGTHSGGSNAPLRFSFGEDTATGLDEVQSTKYDVQSTSIYDLQGRRVAQPTKGIYIVNGKKVFMK